METDVPEVPRLDRTITGPASFDGWSVRWFWATELYRWAKWSLRPSMKTVPTRLSREQAKEILAKVESTVDSQQGRDARDAVVKALNSSVKTYSWVGIYLVKGQDLLLDAWSGPIATEHVKIPIGKGVCGFAAKAGRTEIVSDVSKDPRYLQCFPSTKAEIVVPILHQNRIVGEIDIDSEELSAFSSVDREFLEAVATKISGYCLE